MDSYLYNIVERETVCEMLESFHECVRLPVQLIDFHGKILESYELFDIYEGAQIKEGYKSMAYSVVFRDHDKTLEEAEITAAMKKILNGLTDLGIELRS